MKLDTPKIENLTNNGLLKTTSSDGTLTDTTVLDTDATLAADSDTRVATQKATKAYVDAQIGAENYWDKASGTTVLTPHTSNDSVDLGSGDFKTTGNFTDGTNASSAANVKDAVDKKHTQGTDTSVASALTGILKATTGTLSAAVADTDYVPAVMSALGDIMYGGASGVATRLGVGGANTLLHGGTTPSYSAVVEDDISLSANTTNDTSVSKHGFAPALSGNATQYLNGEGNWVTPAGQTNSYTSQSFTTETSVVVLHNFGAYPIVQIVDDTGAVIIPQSIVNDSVNRFTVTFSEATTGNVLATLGSPQAQAVKSVSTDYSILATDRIICVTASGKTITAPIASYYTGREYVIDNASVGNVYLDGESGVLIQNESMQTIPPDCAIHIYSNGSQWRIY